MRAMSAHIQPHAGGTPAQRFAAFATALRASKLPAPVVEHAKLCILDAIGIALAATRYDFADAVLGAARTLGGEGSAPVIGARAGLPLRDALLVNGTLVHGLDFDDTHTASVTHCTASAWPLAFTLGHERGANGAEVLAAYVAAVEIDARIGEAARGGFQTRGFHPTGIVGAFGCAAAAARLYGLPPDHAAAALGIVLSMAAGSMEFLADGAWTKRIHPGWAAVSGVTAAALAGAGFVGPTQPFEGRFGLYNTLLGPAHGIDPDALGADLGQSWRTTGVAVKPYPACHFNHAFADAALVLKHRHGLDPARISRITALIHPDQVSTVCEPLAAKQRPANHYEAQFSVPWIVAAALVRDRFTLAELEPAALADPAILALAARVGYAADPASAYPRHYSGALEVGLDDGRVLRHREDVNRGAGERPLSRADILDKFAANAGQVLADEAAAHIAGLVLALEAAPSVAPLAAALTGGAATAASAPARAGSR
jgi:2-methylcitrate dehydratase PrpD